MQCYQIYHKLVDKRAYKTKSGCDIKAISLNSPRNETEKCQRAFAKNYCWETH